MTTLDFRNPWTDVISVPVANRMQKPRNDGLTMVMDKGLGLNDTLEMLSVSGKYIDYIKLAFGTSALYTTKLLRSKISAVKDHDIFIYPGGTFLEIAVMQKKMEDFLHRAGELGFSAIEVSDGTIPMTREVRVQVIRTAISLGFEVISEVGKKDPNSPFIVGEVADQIKGDLDAGVSKVILEARESGRGIGVFDGTGDIIKDKFEEVLSEVRDVNLIIWEAPLKNQQQELILNFGPNVNLGNISPAEVLALESLRVGLRSDTLKPLADKAAESR